MINNHFFSELMPNEIPFHPNWKMSESHIAYWQLIPTVDHVVPVSRGGVNHEHNLQILCMSCNGQKGTKTMGEWLGVPA